MRARLFGVVFALLVAQVAQSAAGDDLKTGLQAAAGTTQRGVEAPDSTAPGAARADASKARIKKLIEDLGSPRYTVRRMAANELRQIGAEAFDLLNAAMDSADPEVAASADYLSRQITVRWVESDDPPLVRRILRNYGDLPEDRRARDIEALARLPRSEGTGALCRIARYERSPLLAREAALRVIRPDERHANDPPIDPETIDRELGTSTRTAANWLRLYRLQLRDPAEAAGEWKAFIDDEVDAHTRNSDDTNAEIVLGLLWNQAELYRQLDQHAELLDAVDRMVRLDADELDRTVADLLAWITQHKSWSLLDEFLSKYDAQVSQSKRPLYFAAVARARQGKSELASELADKAAAIQPDQLLESFAIAQELENRSFYDWAVREYQQVINQQGEEGVTSQESILSRISLANLQHDHAKYAEAAGALEPLVEKIQSQGNAGILYAEIRQYYQRRYDISLPDSKSLSAKLHHYRACQYHESGDIEREREELQRAIQRDKSDADVLIQMYRLPNQDETWNAMVRQRIRELAEEMQEQIDESPNDSTGYNQWAWLIANTEGDFQKAIRYSHKSLELLGPAASDSSQATLLDTLGRCYYAAGDLENAVKYQREAVAKLDHMQVMKRQLALFEQALAEKRGASGEE